MNLMTMKKRNSPGRDICLLALAVLALSCTKEMTQELTAPDATFVIEATSSEDFRTVLEGKDVLWTDSDTLSLFSYSESPSNCSIQGGIVPESFSGKSAKFKITTQSGMRPKILVNPQNESYELRGDGSVKIPLPSTWHLQPGKAPGESMISAGEIAGDKVVMRNLLSYMKLTIESDYLTRIRIKTNDSTAISGAAYFNPATLKTEVEGDDGFYVYPADTSVFLPGVYYIPVPSVKCAKGLNLKFYKGNGDAAGKSMDSSYEIVRGKFIDMGKESDLDLKYQPSSRTISIVFYYPEGCVFPFSDKPDAAAPMSVAPTWQQIIGKGAVGPYYPVGYPGVEVYFFLAPLGSKTKSYFISQGTYGMRYGVWAGDYMTIPALPGYRLAALSLEYGTKTSFYAVTTDPASGTPETLVTFSGNNKVVNFTFTSTQTSPGTSYRLSITKDDYQTAIKNVTYTYETD